MINANWSMKQRRWIQFGLSLLFAFAGVMHFIAPAPFMSIMPRWIPDWMPSERTLVYLSGVAEIAGAAGLLIAWTRRMAGIGLLVLLVAVFPANVQMLQNAVASSSNTWYIVLLWLRLPLQPLLMWLVWKCAVATSP